MTHYEIVSELYQNGFIPNYFLQQSFSTDRANAEDEIQEIVLQLLEYGQKLEELYKDGGMNRCRKYISGLIYRQIHSKTSKLYYKYKRHVERVVSINEIMDKTLKEEEGNDER